MELQITGLALTSNSLSSHITDKFNQTHKKFEFIKSTTVHVSALDKGFQANAQIQIKGNQFNISVQHHDAYTAVNLLQRTVNRKLRSQKSKYKSARLRQFNLKNQSPEDLSSLVSQC